MAKKGTTTYSPHSHVRLTSRPLKFYITTAIDYIDDVMHIGHAYQKIVADVLARYHRLLGENVFFLTGADEHGGKAEEAAKKAKMGFKEWADKIAEENKKELKSLNISYDRYIRTTDKDHEKMVKDFWLKVKKRGDIYLGDYVGIYCQGCEGFITQKDLVNGRCPFHPTKAPLKISEKNYFFRWSKYEKFLKNYIKNNPQFIQPEACRNEMLEFLKRGIKDIPISRPTVKWGIPVPDDPEQTIYVWFDALINYLTGAPKGFWPADLHLLGKDNVRWHALLWPAMLKSAGYPLPKMIFGHGFITLEGKKISKSLGNIIRPSQLVERFGGADPIRYYLLKIKPLAEDGDLSLNKLTEVYNADLASGLGNLVARVLTLATKLKFKNKKLKITDQNLKSIINKTWKDYHEALNGSKFNEALISIWKLISFCDKYIEKERPWEEKNQKVISNLLLAIKNIAELLQPFLPETSEKILKQLKTKKPQALFPKI
jgi:methionyl-tRNA synthetase